MNTEQLVQVREEVVFDRTEARTVLICLDDSKKNKVGDCIVRFSNIKWLQFYFPNARFFINSPSRVFYEVAKHSPAIEKFANCPVERIEFNDYDVVLLLVDDRSLYSKCIGEYIARQRDVRFAVFALTAPQDNIEIMVPIPTLPELDEEVPAHVLDEIRKREIFLQEDELMEGARFLDQYIGDEKVIIFMTNSSTFLKTLKMSVTIDLIRWFESLPGRRLVIFDPDNDRELFFRSCGVEFNNTVVVKGKSLRETFAIMADKRVELIFGPCTGLLHAGSGIYNNLLKRDIRTTIPHMLVYTGMYYEISDAKEWWEGSLVKCMVLKKDLYWRKKISLLEEVDTRELIFQENILPTSEYTTSMIVDFFKKHCQL